MQRSAIVTVNIGIVMVNIGIVTINICIVTAIIGLVRFKVASRAVNLKNIMVKQAATFFTPNN